MRRYIKESLKHILRSCPFISHYLRDVEELYRLSPEELRQRNEKVFLEIFHSAYNQSSFYHKWYIENGIKEEDIRSLEDIKKLPVLTKEMVREHGLEMLTTNKIFLIKGHTSGTTGSPLTVYESWPSIWIARAYLVYYRKLCGFEYGRDVIASMRGHLDKKDTYSYIHCAKTLYLSSYNINPETTKVFFNVINDRKPKAIEGYPSTLYSFALFLKDQNLELHIPLCFTSSENLYDYQRTIIEKVFNTIIFDHYGLTERTISLSETLNHDGYYEVPGFSLNEYYDNCIISTSLINKAFPLIRYKNGDSVEMKTPQMTNKLDIIKSINGRSNLFLVGKDDTRYSGAGLTYVIKDCPEIQYAQFIQHEKGKVNLNVVVNPDMKLNKESILFFIEQKIGLKNMDVTIRTIGKDEIILTSRGKFNFIVSDLIN